jgi:hypothetical protein
MPLAFIRHKPGAIRHKRHQAPSGTENQSAIALKRHQAPSERHQAQTPSGATRSPPGDNAWRRQAPSGLNAIPSAITVQTQPGPIRRRKTPAGAGKKKWCAHLPAPLWGFATTVCGVSRPRQVVQHTIEQPTSQSGKQSQILPKDWHPTLKCCTLLLKLWGHTSFSACGQCLALETY